jgi:hypothetical protein
MPVSSSSTISEGCKDMVILKDWMIEYRDLNDLPYDLDTDRRLIIVHNFGLSESQLNQSLYFQSQVDLAKIEAIRMARHVERLNGTIEQYQPEQVLLAGRICVADCQVQKIIHAYNMKLDGQSLLWKYLLCSDISDMVLVFDKTFEKLSLTHDDQDASDQATTAAFNLWFSNNDRVHQCDHNTLSLLDDMMDDGVTFGTKNISKNVLACLTSSSDDQTSYLDRFLQQDILNNPYYRDTKDEYDSIHLMQIISDNKTYRVGDVAFSDQNLAARFAICE